MKKKVPSWSGDELDGAGAPGSRWPGRRDRPPRPSACAAPGPCSAPALLDHLLVAALDRAVALEQIEAPVPSAKTWISICRGGSGTSRPAHDRRRTRPWPRAWPRQSIGEFSALSTTRMPCAAAGRGLDQHREADLRGLGRQQLRRLIVAVIAGTSGTRALSMIFLASLLEPMARIESAGGPMNTMPAAAQASAKPAFLGEKPVSPDGSPERRSAWLHR